jgi:hypothetical protein
MGYCPYICYCCVKSIDNGWGGLGLVRRDFFWITVYLNGFKKFKEIDPKTDKNISNFKFNISQYNPLYDKLKEEDFEKHSINLNQIYSGLIERELNVFADQLKSYVTEDDYFNEESVSDSFIELPNYCHSCFYKALCIKGILHLKEKIKLLQELEHEEYRNNFTEKDLVEVFSIEYTDRLPTQLWEGSFKNGFKMWKNKPKYELEDIILVYNKYNREEKLNFSQIMCGLKYYDLAEFGEEFKKYYEENEKTEEIKEFFETVSSDSD